MISIIIPILNEAETIGKLIQYLLNSSSTKNVAEIIVVDGGSSDESRDIVSTFLSLPMESRIEQEDFAAINNTEVKLVSSAKGRAIQMNFGAKISNGNILYFLHADSLPPQDFDQLIINEVHNGNEAGCFRLQFDSNHWWLRLASWLTQFRWRACRGGDQSQFITRQLFDEIGGYDERFIIYEDNILINQLFKRKQFVVINKKLRTSARRYRKHGVWKLQYHFWMIYVKKWLGADADKLYAYYKKHIC